jgi:tRNA (mo5U34)-methyltransferase
MSMTLETDFVDPRTPLEEEIARLSPWFHNLHLPGEVETAPGHSLGDFPMNKWRHIEPDIPADLSGWSVLDIGCNAGFYSFALAQRGAMVTAIDNDEHYLAQARWAAGLLGLEKNVSFRNMSVYETGRADWQFDIVWFMGVFYHLRYPLLALDIISSMNPKLLVFQTLTMPGEDDSDVPDTIGLGERDRMLQPGWPLVAFIEKRLEGDPTNWWAPNHAAVQAMLRSSGFRLDRILGEEIYLCVPDAHDPWNIKNHITMEMHSALGGMERNI